MEKESVIKVPQSYQKLLSSCDGKDSLGKDYGRQKLVNKCWCYLTVVILFALLFAFVSIWCLTVEVAMLQKKVAVLQTVTKEDIKVMLNFGKILSTHLKTSMSEKMRSTTGSVSEGIPEDEDDLLSIDYSTSLIEGYDGDGGGSDNDNNVDDFEDYDEDDDDDEEDDDSSDEPGYAGDKNSMNRFDDVGDDEDDDTEPGKIKKKREIRGYDTSEEMDAKNVINETEVSKSLTLERKSSEKLLEEKTSSEKPSTEIYSSEKSSEYTSRERFIPSTYRLSRKSHLHRKHRKSRIGSAEKFFTETHSTSSAPIQVRRSRTKATQSHEVEKKPWLPNQMLQQHTSALRDTITKEEALLRGYSKYLEDGNYELDSSSREKIPDPLTYNMITIHFSADTSHYSRERDPHYFGNGRMQIKSEVYKDWKPAHWTQGIGMSKYFHLNQGRVTVSMMGIYLIYAQIQYSNIQEVNGFSVFRNNEVVVQCITTSTHPDKHEIKSNTCGISTTILLQSNDSICIKDLHHGRYVVLTPEKSYFGLVLLSPFKK